MSPEPERAFSDLDAALDDLARRTRRANAAIVLFAVLTPLVGFIVPLVVLSIIGG